MKMAVARKGQVYSVGNYLMTGKVLGKGHFARVEEATHRTIGKKVAIKIIDLTCIKEEYARRNLHREPRVMAKLRHPCIAALYETMMHGPRLYVVMEVAGGGDLCAYVLSSRSPARGLPEGRARGLAGQLVSAVRHMHVRGVVHRDLKMENIMLDSTKQFIKIVDFGLSNTWSAGGALRTPCGSLEYAAPELFVDGRRYGPEVDLWSIGVIVYGMVTGGLPFGGGRDGREGQEGQSRPLLRAAITRGFTRKQRAALACVTPDCKTFIQQLLEPNVEQRMKIEEAARHRWVKKPGLRMKTHPLANPELKVNRELHKQISELCGLPMTDVIATIRGDPYGSLAGMYNILTHLHQMQAVPGADLLWSSNTLEPRPASPPSFHAKYELDKEIRPEVLNGNTSKVDRIEDLLRGQLANPQPMLTPKQDVGTITASRLQDTNGKPAPKFNAVVRNIVNEVLSQRQATSINQRSQRSISNRPINKESTDVTSHSPRLARPFVLKKPVFRVFGNGDCLEPRLPSIEEHSNVDSKACKRRPCVRKVNLEEPVRLNSCPQRLADTKRSEFYRKAGDGLPSWRSGGATPSARLLLQTTATAIKRASLGNITSPHSSSNSHCKSERAMPVGWFSRNTLNKETHLQRLRRTAPMK